MGIKLSSNSQKNGKIPITWENSHKIGNFSFIVRHVAFDKLRASFLQILKKLGTFP
jgi:hypothetical protein